MRNFLMVFFLIWAIITGTFQDQIILIQLVIPAELLPYYDWLGSFPDLDLPEVKPIPTWTPTLPTENL